MPTSPLSDELCQQAVDATLVHGSVSAASRALSLPYATFQTRVNTAKRRGFAAKVKSPREFKTALAKRVEGVRIATLDIELSLIHI